MYNDYHYLYVEDDSLSWEIMQMIMGSAMGVRNLTIFKGSEDFMARVKALPHKPDIIMLDIHIGPYDGFEMLAMLRADADYDSSRIVALTASVMSEEVERLRAAGFDGAIAKPLSVQAFPALMEQIINGENVWYIV
jgi:CheY-like chemotaxis protein